MSCPPFPVGSRRRVWTVVFFPRPGFGPDPGVPFYFYLYFDLKDSWDKNAKSEQLQRWELGSFGGQLLGRSAAARYTRRWWYTRTRVYQGPAWLAGGSTLRSQRFGCTQLYLRTLFNFVLSPLPRGVPKEGLDCRFLCEAGVLGRIRGFILICICILT